MNSYTSMISIRAKNPSDTRRTMLELEERDKRIQQLEDEVTMIVLLLLLSF